MVVYPPPMGNRILNFILILFLVMMHVRRRAYIDQPAYMDRKAPSIACRSRARLDPLHLFQTSKIRCMHDACASMHSQPRSTNGSPDVHISALYSRGRIQILLSRTSRFIFRKNTNSHPSPSFSRGISQIPTTPTPR